MNKDRKTVMAILFSLLTVCLIALDQVTKAFIMRTYEVGGGQSFIKDFFSFYYTKNTGSAFSFLADKAWGIYVLTGFSTLLALIVLYFLIKSIRVEEYLVAGSLMLLFSGAVGNLIDRYRLHFVVDFIRFDFGEYTFPIFNIADICAVAGTFILIAVMIFLPKRAEKVW